MDGRAQAPGARFGMAGLGVMGRNLALNVAEHGFPVVVWNRSREVADALVAEHPGRGLESAASLRELVAALGRPRAVMLMVPAGPAVDGVLADLVPLLEPGDVVVDGGNSWFEDTRRRERELRARDLRFVGVGVSGGEEGARHGPSLMPGGDAEAYRVIAPVLEAIAARTESGACVTHVGPDGAGHFVKMVHNGIEYADMQLIAEAYWLLSRVGCLGAGALAETFAAWNEGPLASFLVEITARIFGVRDDETGRPLVELVADAAAQKGTGRWTVQVALDQGVAVPTIAAAVDARVISSDRDARRRTGERLALALDAGPAGSVADGLVERVHDALLAAKVCAFAQGLALARRASQAFDWGIDLAELARIWKGGCILRARLLDGIMAAYRRDPELPSLVLDDGFAARLAETHGALRACVGLAQSRGLAAPALSASLAWLDGVRGAESPLNLTQAQRDAFGAHTYERRDRPGRVHTDWLGS